MKSSWSNTIRWVLLGVSLLACSNSADGPRFPESVILEAVKLEAPSTVGPSLTLTVALTLAPGSCTSFDRIDVQRSGSEIRLTAFGLYHGALPCVMPRDILETVQLAPPFPSRFTVVAAQPAGVEPLSASVTVQ
jgi:hypothetical protein